MGWESDVTAEVHVRRIDIDIILNKMRKMFKINKKHAFALEDISIKKRDDDVCDSGVLLVHVSVKYGGSSIAEEIIELIKKLNAKYKNIMSYKIYYRTSEYCSVEDTEDFESGQFSNTVSEHIGYNKEKITITNNSGRKTEIHHICSDSENCNSDNENSNSDSLTDD
jgi:hypothetical protein